MESKRILSSLVELQMCNRGGKIELWDSMVLGGIILICRGCHRARLYQTLGPHLGKPWGSFFIYKWSFNFINKPMYLVYCRARWSEAKLRVGNYIFLMYEWSNSFKNNFLKHIIQKNILTKICFLAVYKNIFLLLL